MKIVVYSDDGTVDSEWDDVQQFVMACEFIRYGKFPATARRTHVGDRRFMAGLAHTLYLDVLYADTDQRQDPVAVQ